MKRLGVVVAALVLTLLFQTTAAFATGTLQIVDYHPRNDANNVYQINFAAKIYFDRDVSSAMQMDSNLNNFVLRDANGERIEVIVINDPNNPEMILVAVNREYLRELQPSMEHTLTISGNFQTSEGNFLGDDYVIRFTTRDMGRDLNVSMFMMAGFLIVMMFITSKKMKRDAEKKEQEEAAKVNPYKVSKKTGKSVAEVIERAEKQKKKKEAIEAKLLKNMKLKEEEYEDDEDDYDEDSDNYRVSGPRPISAISAYKSGKKAKYEAAAKKKAAAGTTRPKNQTAKAKHKNKK